jgi:hypothetical protein
MAVVEPGPLELTQLDVDGPAHVLVRVELTAAAPLGPLSGGIGEPQVCQHEEGLRPKIVYLHYEVSSGCYLPCD